VVDPVADFFLSDMARLSASAKITIGALENRQIGAKGVDVRCVKMERRPGWAQGARERSFVSCGVGLVGWGKVSLTRSCGNGNESTWAFGSKKVVSFNNWVA